MTTISGKCQNLPMSPAHLCVISYRFKDKKVFFLNSNSRSRSHGTIFAMTPFDGKCQNIQMSQTLIVLDILKNLILELQNLGEGHDVQFWYLHHSMANVKICKWLP